MNKPGTWVLIPVLAFVLLFLHNARLHGRYEDAGRQYIDFRLTGTAYTNRGAGNGETQITYDRAGDRVTLHELDGNPTLRLNSDGTLCCGDNGVFRKHP